MLTVIIPSLIDVGVGECISGRIGILALSASKRRSAHQRPEALRVVRLPRRYYEGEWSTSGTAMSVEFGGEPTSRSAKRLGLLSPFYADPTMARIGDEGLGLPPLDQRR